ncbi:CotD family spore coat protein [Salirhabdus sp. Marseille-P4669]|uniref:CotD family spore coat protein n=1 Tax=Salirhabdus sp. Marseille-P4669 TaxID=2042310 RepID=UPI000C7DBA47|nr:CotD family spore coat protein [Salirhabdus sp. Marseille-P4669]
MRHHKCCRPRPTALSPAETVVHPTKHCVKNNFIPHEVNHIHPTHTTIQNHHVVKNNHFYPHTQSVVNSVNTQHVNMGPGRPQMVSPANMGPNAVSPAGMNPNPNNWC